jgi:hypothetical protein
MSETIIYRQLQLPLLQNRVYDTRAEALAAPLGDVELVQCAATGLVHNRLFDPSALAYDQNYQNEQACSAAFRTHLEEVMQIVLRHYAIDQIGIEIGCGKGHFLERLLEAGANFWGFDPSYEGSNKRVVRAYFDEDSTSILPNFFVLRHVLEHIDRPWDFLRRVGERCTRGTKIYIEVPCFDWIVQHRAFYDIFYEHVNYFTLQLLQSAFTSPIESGHLFDRQYLFVVADLSTFHTPTAAASNQFSPLNFDFHVDALLFKRRDPNKGAFVWGAGAKGVTFANILSRKRIYLDAMVDINPAKQKNYCAGVGLPIVSPNDARQRIDGADVFVMNPVYLSEIKLALGGVDVNLIPVI